MSRPRLRLANFPQVTPSMRRRRNKSGTTPARRGLSGIPALQPLPIFRGVPPRGHGVCLSVGVRLGERPVVGASPWMGLPSLRVTAQRQRGSGLIPAGRPSRGSAGKAPGVWGGRGTVRRVDRHQQNNDPNRSLTDPRPSFRWVSSAQRLDDERVPRFHQNSTAPAPLLSANSPTARSSRPS